MISVSSVLLSIFSIYSIKETLKLVKTNERSVVLNMKSLYIHVFLIVLYVLMYLGTSPFSFIKPYLVDIILTILDTMI